jgi:hypothetical protein
MAVVHKGGRQCGCTIVLSTCGKRRKTMALLCRVGPAGSLIPKQYALWAPVDWLTGRIGGLRPGKLLLLFFLFCFLFYFLFSILSFQFDFQFCSAGILNLGILL